MEGHLPTFHVRFDSRARLNLGTSFNFSSCRVCVRCVTGLKFDNSRSVINQLSSAPVMDILPSALN